MALKDIKVIGSNRPTPIPPKKKCFFVYSVNHNIDKVVFADYSAQAERWFRDWCNENCLPDSFVTIRECDWHLLDPFA